MFLKHNKATGQRENILILYLFDTMPKGNLMFG